MPLSVIIKEQATAEESVVAFFRFGMARKCHFSDILLRRFFLYHNAMSKEELDGLILRLREIGVSREICDQVRKNADAGAVEFALWLLAGDDRNEYLD